MPEQEPSARPICSIVIDIFPVENNQLFVEVNTSGPYQLSDGDLLNMLQAAVTSMQEKVE